MEPSTRWCTEHRQAYIAYFSICYFSTCLWHDLPENEQKRQRKKIERKRSIYPDKTLSTGFSSVSRDIHSACNSNKKCFVIRHLANLKMRCICSQGKIILICYNISLFTNHFDLSFFRCLLEHFGSFAESNHLSQLVRFLFSKYFRFFGISIFVSNRRATIIWQTACKEAFKMCLSSAKLGNSSGTVKNTQ